MSTDIRTNLGKLHEALLTGKLMAAFEELYHDDVVMSENGIADPNRVGKAKNRGYEQYFVDNAKWHDARLGAICVDPVNGTSAYEMYMDFTMGDQRIKRTQVAVQQWKDGRIVRETFYYPTA